MSYNSGFAGNNGQYGDSGMGTGASNSSNNNNGTNQYQLTDDTPMALLEQLVYVDNFMQNGDVTDSGLEPNFDEQLSAELAAFADDSFIFPDEEKPKVKIEGSSSGLGLANAADALSTVPQSQSHSDAAQRTIPSTIHELLHPRPALTSQDPVGAAGSAGGAGLGTTDLNTLLSAQQQSGSLEIKRDSSTQLPRVNVPRGAQSTLSAAGLSQTQIEALATLIAYHKPNILDDQQQTQPPAQPPTQQSAPPPPPPPQRSHASSLVQESSVSPATVGTVAAVSTTPAAISSSAQVSKFEPILHTNSSTSHYV